MNIILKESKKVIGALLIIILILVGLSNVFIIKDVKAEEKSNEVQGVISNDEDIKNFMNNYFNEKMKKYSVPGASVVVVKDNKEVFKMGYGYSNLESEALVDPDKTSFPACSVSKLFTATAIMKLYEEGKIDLDRNINDYISPYKVSNKYDKAITCRNLLTHSSGLDEASELDGATTDENFIKSQEYFMDNHTPVVVTEPNTICRYSNEGYNLLGYIVEKVSGINYEEYVKEKILQPLNMNNSSVRLKSSDTAIGYTYDNYNYVANPLPYQYTSGSAGIIATARDMENFIIANLNNGQFQNNSILSKNILALMQSKQFSNAEDLPGMGFGFIRSYRNGQEIIKHEGGLPGYTTTLFLIPKENLGIYIATNSLGALPFNFEEEFLNYFYAETNNDFNTIKKNSTKYFSKYEGTYRSYDGSSKSNIMKIFAIFDPENEMKIKDNKDGTLTLNEVTTAKEEITTILVEKQQGVFLRKDGKGDFAFRFDKDGNVTYAFNDISHNSFEKIKFYESGEFNTGIWIIFIAAFIFNIILTIVQLIKRKRKETPKLIKRIKLLNLLIEVFNIIGAFGVIQLTTMMIINNNFSFKYPLYVCLSLIIVACIMFILSLLLLIYFYRIQKGLKKEKIYFTLIEVVNLAFIWFLYYSNLLGYKIY